MLRIRRYLGIVLFTAVATVPLLSAGCAARVRGYDQYHADSHRWNRGEDRYYRQYLGERRLNYRDFRRLNDADRRAYWNWRQNHR